MSNLRLGDIIDDYCIKCRRLTNHAIVSIVNEEVAKVRCRSCYHDHDYLHEQIPPSKKDLKKLELFNAVLQKIDPSTADEIDELEEEEELEEVEEQEVKAPPAPASKSKKK